MEINEPPYRISAKFVHKVFMEWKVQSYFGHMQMGLYYGLMYVGNWKM